MDKVIANTSTRISLNDRFTMMSKAKSQSPNKMNARANNKRIASRNGAGSIRNRRLVEDLEKRLKLRAALKIKNVIKKFV